jgi:receptor protein-tyrosine kinase
MFKLERNVGLSGILADRAGLEVAQHVPGLPNLAVLTAGPTPPNPQELLGRPSFGQLLIAAYGKFDVILIDTPCGTDYADAEIIAASKQKPAPPNNATRPSPARQWRRAGGLGVE